MVCFLRPGHVATLPHSATREPQEPGRLLGERAGQRPPLGDIAAPRGKRPFLRCFSMGFVRGTHGVLLATRARR